jgi:hypothetical protein
VNPAQEPGGDNIALFPSDPNKGLVLLSVNGGPAASAAGNTAAASAAPVLSVLPTVPEETTYSYRYTASTDDDVKDKLVEGEIPQGDSPLPVELAGGLWTITVKAWEGTAPAEDEEDPPAPAFVGTAALDVGAGAAQPLVVSLLPNGEGTGTFSYSVTFTGGTNFPDGLGYALISVFPLDGGAVVDVIDLLTGQSDYAGITVISGEKKLPGGYYNITTAVNYMADSVQKFATKREVLYIYDGLTSSYTVTFETGDFTALLPAVTGRSTYAVRTFNTTNATAFWNNGNGWNSLSAFLARCPQNTPDTPYLIALNGFKLDGTDTGGNARIGNSTDPLAGLFAVTQGRYVSYDLRSCAGTISVAATNYDYFSRAYPDRVTGVILPASVTTIPAYAFAGATSLSYVAGPSITEIGIASFKNCTSLRFFNLDSLTKNPGTGAFSNSGLVTVDLPSTVTSLVAFDGCQSIKSLTLRNDKVFTSSNTFPVLDVVYVPESQLASYRIKPQWTTVMETYAERTGREGTELFQAISE